MTKDPWSQWQKIMADWSSDPAAAPLLQGLGKFQSDAQAFLAGLTGRGSGAYQDAAQAFGRFIEEQIAHQAGPWPAGGWPQWAPKDQQQLWQDMIKAGQSLESARARIRDLWTESLQKAAAGFQDWLHQHTAGARQPDVKELYDAWVSRAEAAWSQVAHGAAFTKAQAEFLGAAGQWREQLQSAMEMWARAAHLPTQQDFQALEARIARLEKAGTRSPAPKKATRRAAPKKKRARQR